MKAEGVHPDAEVQSDLTRAVVGGAGLTTAGVVLSGLLTLASYLVLARLAAPEVFGAFAAASIALGAGGIFVESGMLAALIHRRDRLEEAANTAFVATMLGGLALALIALAASPLIGLVFSSRRIGIVAAALSGMLLLGAGTVVPDALLQRRFSFLRRVLVDPLGVGAFGATAIPALSAGLGVWGLVLATYASELVQVIAAWKASGFRPELRRASFAMWKELTGYGRHVLKATLVDHVSLATNTALLGRFVSTSALGEYRYATRFSTLPEELAVNAGSYVLFPAFARIAPDRVRSERAFLRSLRWLVAAVLPVSLLLLPLGRPLVVLLLGEPWRPAGVALMILCLASAPRAAGSVSAASLKAIGRPDVLPALHLLQAVLTIALTVALVPFGLLGIAAGVTAGAVASNAVALFWTARVQSLSWRAIAAAIGAPYAAGAAMIALLLPLDRLSIHADAHGTAVGLGLLAGEAVAGLALYATCLLALSPATRIDLAGAVRAAVLRARPAPALGEPQPPSSPASPA